MTNDMTNDLDFTSLDFTHEFGKAFYNLGASNAVALAMIAMNRTREQVQPMLNQPYHPAYWRHMDVR